jgi:hypothetical protein
MAETASAPLFRQLLQRNNYRAALSHGLYFALLAAAGRVCAIRVCGGRIGKSGLCS